MSNKLIQGCIAGLAGTAVVLLLWAGGALKPAENELWDMRVRHFAEQDQPSDKVKLIFIDQYTLDWAEEHHGMTWQWMRQAYVYILDFLQRGKPRAVTFDMLFSDTSDDGVADDLAFGTAIAGTSNFVQAFMLSEQHGAGEWPQQLTDKTISVCRFRTFLEKNNRDRITLPKASFPVDEIATNAAILGSAYFRPDAGVLRRAPVFQVFDDHFVPSLALATFAAGNPSASIRITNNTMIAGNHRIPMDSSASSILRYRGASQAHEAFNAAAIIQSEVLLRQNKAPIVEPSEFNDCYVFFGTTAQGLLDIRTTPVSEVYPGVEIHATMLDNILSDDLIQDFPHLYTALLTLALAVIAGIAGRFCAKAWRLVLIGAVLVPLPVLLGFLAYPYGYWLNVTAPGFATLLTLAGIVVLNYTVEGRQKRFIKGAFKQYLSPIVIDRLVREPDRLKLGGESRELSIYFSDIQGFTSISEKLSPEELTDLLNTYLTAMTDIILNEGGTIDKYEGDAIIAFWNAPVDQADHPERAVRAALRCQDKLNEMRPELKKIAGTDLCARIGLNTGPVVVGNMGSDQRFDYTFLGDAGNLAARLESLNKQFGTYAMISEFTKQKLSDRFAARELSRVRVIGKNVPITVFEPMWPQHYNANREKYEAFDVALKHYYEGSFKDALQAFLKIEDDPPSARYAEKCREFADNPPESWDGVWQAAEK